MNMRELRAGDIVTITATITQALDNDDEYYVKLNGERDRSVFIHFTEVKSVELRTLKVGDRVNVNGATTNPGTIAAIVGDEAWVKWDSGPPTISSHSYLYRVRS